jgi:hypothetical protein
MVRLALNHIICRFLQTFILSMPHLSLLCTTSHSPRRDNGLTSAVISDYLPVYYQACKDASPTASGVDLFGIAFSIAPITMLTGFSVNVFKRYRPQLWLGWAILVVASGLLNTITADSSRAKSIGFQIINGLGIGLLYMNLYFPILAPLPITSSAQALAFYNYVHALAQVRVHFCSINPNFNQISPRHGASPLGALYCKTSSRSVSRSVSANYFPKGSKSLTL